MNTQPDTTKPAAALLPPVDREVAEVLAQFRAAAQNLPDTVEIPYSHTPEAERMAKFRKVCDAEFMKKVDRTLLRDPVAYAQVANWDGKFPGPLAVGGTGCRKTGAAWVALGRLWVRENKAFAWFPAKRLITELLKYEERSAADEFWKYYGGFKALLVDDVDKINWQFESNLEALFAFYDWVYRAHIPCITTTNKDRAWWSERMGEPFARRLFDEAHRTVTFTARKAQP